MQTSFMNQEQASAWIRDFTAESAKALVHKSRVGAISQVIFAPFQFDVLKLGLIASAARQSGLSVCFIALDNEIVGIGFQAKHDCLVDGWPDFDGSIVGAKVDTSAFDADVIATIMRNRVVHLDEQTKSFAARYGFMPTPIDNTLHTNEAPSARVRRGRELLVSVVNELRSGCYSTSQMEEVKAEFAGVVAIFSDLVR